MASWASLGHGMRRRMGAPSNHLESAGHEMAERNHETAEEAHERAAAAGSHRIPVGSNIDWSVSQPNKGIAVPRKNTQAADGTIADKANRKNVERTGARFTVTPKSTFTQVDPAAGPTMNSARIVPSVSGRENPNFESGISSSM